jgi:hypothetical protein
MFYLEMLGRADSNDNDISWEGQLLVNITVLFHTEIFGPCALAFLAGGPLIVRLSSSLYLALWHSQLRHSMWAT